MKGVTSRFGLALPPGINPALKNAAAVMITAELPAFAKPGQRLDITSPRSARPSRSAAGPC
jgi:flagellar P-ring protein precursor FlgI